MISNINKIKILIVILTILSLSWTSFNLFYFTHFHIDKTGKIIVHSHPYQKEDNQNKSAPTHTHSKNEFTLLALIYNVLSFFTILIISLFFLLNFKTNLKSYIFLQWNPTDYFFKNILRRGPPSMLQFI